MDYGNAPTFAGSKEEPAYSEKFYEKINKKWSILSLIDDEFKKEKRTIVRAYTKLEEIMSSRTDKENDAYYEDQKAMLNAERGRIFALDVSQEEKAIRYKEIDEYERYLKFMIYDFHKYSPFLRSKYIDQELDVAKARFEQKKQEEINEIKKDIELYVRFLNRILIKYNNEEAIYEEYRKVSNHKFDDPELQKIHEDKMYETLILLPRLYEVVKNYSKNEENYSNEEKQKNLQSSAEEKDDKKSQEQSKKTENNAQSEDVRTEEKQKPKEDMFQKLKFSSDEEKIKKIYELLDQAEKENERDYMLDAYGYCLTLPDSEEKKKIESIVYKMVDAFKIQEIKQILGHRPDEESIKKAKKLIYELSYGTEKSALIDFVNKLENPNPVKATPEKPKDKYTIYIADEDERQVLNDDGTPKTDDEMIQKQVAEKVSAMRRAG